MMFDPEKKQKIVRVRLPPARKCAIDLISGLPVERGQVYHFVLHVTDSGSPNLTTYKRVVLQITNKELQGGRNGVVETMTELHYLD